jgi:hypothetical protein
LPLAAQRLSRITVQTGAKAGGAGSALGAVGIVQLQARAGEGGEGRTEKRTEEQIARGGTHGPGFQTKASHHLQTVVQGENDALLCGPQQVRAGVAVEIETVEARAGVAVLEQALGAVAERQQGQPIGADRSGSR